jgi:pimeloyl-ACP methyl ester carboxylesterase
MRLPVIFVGLIVLVAACHQPAGYTAKDLTRNGVKIAYNLCGEKKDTTLLFVHGWCINKTYWEPQLKHFCSSYRVVAIDLPGFGESGKNRANWDFDEYTEDIKYIIEQLELKNVILIGHSMSGDIVLNADNKYPGLLAGIVGIDNLHEPGSPMTPEQKVQTDSFFHLLATSFRTTVNNQMLPALFQPTTDTAVVNRLMNDVLVTDSTVAVDVLRSMIDISQKEKSLMQGLSHKLYLLNSDVFPVKEDSLSRYCSKGFKAELVHATGHYPMIEKPGEFNAALQKIINAIGKK